MKQLLILLLLIFYSFCTLDECEQSTNQDLCNSINVDIVYFLCFKAEKINEDVNDEESTKCKAFPMHQDMQKFYWKFTNGFVKEFFSWIGKLYEDDSYGPIFFEGLENELMQSEKEFYNTGETIKIYPGTLSSLDKDILKSGQTCNYYFYGRHYANPSRTYNNIEDKNICFNARKFNEFKNVIDCGYATIKFNINNKDYEIKTCYLIPTENLPILFNKFYAETNNQLFIDVLLNDIALYMAGIPNDDPLHFNSRRRLSNFRYKYDIIVENKYGRKIQFSSELNNKFNVIEKGELGPEESLETETEGNKSIFIKIYLINLLVILFTL